MVVVLLLRVWSLVFIVVVTDDSGGDVVALVTIRYVHDYTGCIGVVTHCVDAVGGYGCCWYIDVIYDRYVRIAVAVFVVFIIACVVDIDVVDGACVRDDGGVVILMYHVGIGVVVDVNDVFVDVAAFYCVRCLC